MFPSRILCTCLCVVGFPSFVLFQTAQLWCREVPNVHSGVPQHMNTDSFMVASTDPIPVLAAWQPPGQVFFGTDVRPGQQQEYNYLNPASIEAWDIKSIAAAEFGMVDADGDGVLD